MLKLTTSALVFKAGVSSMSKMCCSYIDTLVSGSPIIQNGKLVGAVTHVLIDNPSKGYGIFAENMLDTAQSVEQLKKAG